MSPHMLMAWISPGIGQYLTFRQYHSSPCCVFPLSHPVTYLASGSYSAQIRLNSSR